MVTVYIVLGIVVLVALAWWIWRSRDSGTHDPVAFADPTATDEQQRER